MVQEVYVDTGALFLYNLDFAQRPIHSQVPLMKLSYIPGPRLGCGLRLTPFPLPVFGLSIGVRPQFAQWKKSARGFLGSISFFLRKSYKKKWFIFLTLPEYCEFGMCCLEVPQESSCC